MGERLQKVTLEHVVLVAVVAIGLGLSATSIADNSMLLHMRTGIDMFNSWSIPRRDPYSFTAFGHPWVVQSWLAEWTYGAAHAIGGYRAVVFEQMLLTGILLAAMAALGRSNTMIRTTVALAFPVTLVSGFTPPRPVLFGLLAFALLLLIVERRWSPWWLLPLGWVWVNTHGSFPIGVVWFVVMFVGSSIDTKSFDRRLFRYGWMLVIGLLLGAVNPLGPKLLWFWTNAFGARSEVFSKIVEWSSPDFHDGRGLASLLGIFGIIVVMLTRRPAWRHAIPVAVFLCAGLYSARYLPLLAIAACPALRSSLRIDHDTRKQRATDSARIALAAMAVIVLVVIGMTVRVTQNPGVNTKSYPVAALDKLEAMGLTGPSKRILAPDFVGNYIAFAQTDGTRDFIDDRYDMFPVSVARDYQVLAHAEGDPMPIIARYAPDAVIWQNGGSVATALGASSDWRLVFGDARWVVYVRA